MGIDTSGGLLLVGAQKGEQHCVRRRKGIQQERLLFPAIQSALTALGGKLQDVKKVCLVRGPGRFTGIRIALTCASMLQQLNGAQVYGITAFELLNRQVKQSGEWHRWQAQHPGGVLGIVLHAFREEYFLQIFDAESAGPVWLSREELLQRLAAYNHPLFLAGSDKNDASLAALTGGKYPLAADRDCHIRVNTLLGLAQDDSLQAHALEPLYLKPARFELVNPQ